MTGIPAVLTIVTLWFCMRGRPPEGGEVTHAYVAEIVIQLVIIAIIIGLNEALTPKPQTERAKPAGLGDFELPTATEGRPVPLLWGRVLIKGPNVVWYGDLSQEKIQTTQQRTLFQSDKITIGYRYFLGIQYAICRGPIDEVNGIRIGDEQVFTGATLSDITINEPKLFGGEEFGQGGVIAKYEVYPGSTTQTASDYLGLFQGITQQDTNTVTMPYRGTCYFVFRSSLTDGTVAGGGYIGTSRRLEPPAFEVSRYPPLFTGQSVGDNRIGNDANIANVVYELLTDAEFGFNQPESRLDLAQFKAVSDTFIAEGQGFSFTLQTQVQRDEIKRLIENQIDGLIRINRRTGLWEIRLARADYVVGDLRTITEDNLISVTSYEQPVWRDTTNYVRGEFNESGDAYKLTYAVAQDTANQRIQGRTVTSEIKFPGVKNRSLATNLTWRELRLLSRPLARATVQVTQEFHDTQPLDVVLFTSEANNVTDLPMRVLSVDQGKIDANAMTLQMIEDVFAFREASGGEPPGSLWPDPEASLIPYPTDRQVAIEAPRGLRARDPFDGNVAVTINALVSKVHAWARRAAQETAFDIRTRSNPSGSPSGDFSTAETSTGFALLGTLKSALTRGTAIPTTSLTLTAGPDTKEVLAVSLAAENLANLGVDLANLIYVGDSTSGEFMLVSSAAAGSGTDVDLTNVYRGVLDTPQMDHSAGANVFVVSAGAAITDEFYATTGTIEVKLIPVGFRTEVLEGDATTITVNPEARHLLPSPVSKVFAETVLYGTTPSLEAQGSGLNRGFNVSWERRAYDVDNEITAFDNDDQSVSDQTQQQRVSLVRGGVEIEVQDFTAGAGPILVPRADYLAASTNGAVGDTITIRVRTRHVPTGYAVFLENKFDVEYDVTATSALTGQFALGILQPSGGSVSNSYATVDSGTFTLNLQRAITSNVRVSVNGGAFSTIVAGGNTTGTVVGVTASDTLRFDVLGTTDADNTFIELQNPSSTAVAYGVIEQD